MNNYIVNNFLPEDHEQAEKQLDCYFYNINLSNQALKDGKAHKSSVYLENASRSSKKIAELKDKHDRAMFRLKQIEADRTVSEQLVSVYARQT